MTQAPASAWKTLPRARRWKGWLDAPVGAVRLDATAQRHVVVEQGVGQQRQLVGGRRHVGISEHDEVTGRGQDAGPDRGTLAAVRSTQHPQARRCSVGSRLCLRTRLHDSDGVVLGFIVHEQHVPGPKLARRSPTGTCLTRVRPR